MGNGAGNGSLSGCGGQDAMKRWFALLGLGLCLLSSSCALIEDGHHNICYSISTAIHTHKEKERNRRWAECAWCQVQPHSDGGFFSEDYARGFKDGYAEYLYRGGDGEPPVMAPVRYRHVRYQTPQGYQAVQDWFHGYRHGAMVARDSGARQWVTGPTSLGSEPIVVEPHPVPPPLVTTPIVIPQAPPKAEPIPLPMPKPLPREEAPMVIPQVPTKSVPREEPIVIPDVPFKVPIKVPAPMPDVEVIPLPPPRPLPSSKGTNEPGPVKAGFGKAASSTSYVSGVLPKPTARGAFGLPESEGPNGSAARNWTSPPLRVQMSESYGQVKVAVPAPAPMPPSVAAMKVKVEMPPPSLVENVEPAALVSKPGPSLMENVEPAPLLHQVSPSSLAHTEEPPIDPQHVRPAPVPLPPMLQAMKQRKDVKEAEARRIGLSAPVANDPIMPVQYQQPVPENPLLHGLDPTGMPRIPSMTGDPVIIQNGPSKAGNGPVSENPTQVLRWGETIERVLPQSRIRLGTPRFNGQSER